MCVYLELVTVLRHLILQNKTILCQKNSRAHFFLVNLVQLDPLEDMVDLKERGTLKNPRLDKLVESADRHVFFVLPVFNHFNFLKAASDRKVLKCLFLCLNHLFLCLYYFYAILKYRCRKNLLL